MIKLNKCRTLYAFDEAALKAVLGQTQDTSQPQNDSADQLSKATDNKEENKTNDNLTASQKAQTTTENPHEANKSNTTNDNKENNQNPAQQTGENAQNAEKDKEDSNDNQKVEVNSQQLQYLLFEPDEFLITTYQSDNGWWYGYKDAEVPGEIKYGYFPSNYIQVIEEYEQPSAEPYGEVAEAKANANMDEAFTWNDYAKHSYMDDNQILVQERMKKLNDFTAPENRNPDGILGYKKIKIHESRSHAVNPWKGGRVQSSQVAIKDQSPVSKAYRQINHYFDYDEWVDNMNKNPPPKAKADPSKKKKKSKVLDW